MESTSEELIPKRHYTCIFMLFIITLIRCKDTILNELNCRRQSKWDKDSNEGLCPEMEGEGGEDGQGCDGRGELYEERSEAHLTLLRALKRDFLSIAMILNT